ncbi:50S ribosomal protein L7/L12 [Thermodesulfobium sp. 4217-1]|uniref:50S ribosomal protein L7/L12 n=1 Tax=Thermodesulfobium sp. 4217-1 TaxID=3120013 RepID=UPI0032218A55
MALNKEEILEAISQMTVLELSELIKAFEEKFGVTAAAPVAVAAGVAAAPQEEVEEQTEFDVILTDVGAKKIDVLKVVREITALGLKEAKELVDTVPKPVKEKVKKEEAAEIKAKIEAAGGKVEVK